MNWLTANLGTIVIAIIVAGLVGAVIFNSLRRRKQGKSSCSCGCADCPMKNKCH